MKKKLNDMSIKELGNLFPIIISDPNPDWITLFQEEKRIIIDSLGVKNFIRIEHIGSTAIPNLKAKPTIDILIEVPNEFKKHEFIKKLLEIGYLFTPKPENPAPHMMFMKGYTDDGFNGQAFHIHVRYAGDWDEIYFRDFLLTHPDIAKEYGKLKTKLSNQHRNDREEYTNGKTEFIKRFTQIARRSLPG
jgi:GrpB-like predicted nucleotidyltransferase (UPF0157 family)